MHVLILHGIGGHAGIHWEQWLHDELGARGFTVHMPSLPDGDHPDRTAWLRIVEDVVQKVNPAELIIVGHSLGVTTALDFIEQSPRPIRALVSVSGFASDYGAELNSYFLREQTIDLAKVRRNLGQAIVIYGDDDPYVAPAALAEVATGLGVQPIVIPHGGHLNTERGYTTFPLLLEQILPLVQGS